MRYWIWWNDLIQGPFELDELISLRAFSEDLLVCMEDREEWLPAGRIADLSPAVEQARAQHSLPLTPPPPPPNRPPSVEPLQGEFFADHPGQQPLLESDDEPKGPYAYRPAGDNTDGPPAYFLGQATMPFHFSQQPGTRTSVIELPRPSRETSVRAAPPVIRESPVREIKPVPEVHRPPKQAVNLKVLQEETIPEALEESPPVAREILPDFPSSFESPLESRRRIEWLPWLMGVAIALAALTSMGYWLMDKASTHSAITEANRLEPPVAMSMPATTPLPAPKVDIRDRTMPATVPSAKPPVGKKSFFAQHPLRSMMAFLPSYRRNRQTTGRSASRVAEPVPRTSSMDWAPASAGVTSMIRKKIHTTTRAIKVMRNAMYRRPIVKPVLPASALKSIPIESAPAASLPLKTPSVRSLRTQKKVAHHQPPKPAPVAKPAPAAKPEPVVLPGLAELPSAEPKEVPPVDLQAPAERHAANPWSGRQNEAIKLVVGQKISGGRETVGSHARTMLQQMHEKELMHAAETGERLYLPDKMSWTALQEEGPLYRVYLNFFAWQASGERVQARSYQFLVDFEHKAIKAADPATQQDVYSQAADRTFTHNPMATDLDSILGGVDTYNKHKVGMLIVKKGRSNRDDRKQIESLMSAAQAKIKRGVIYFRRTYPDKALQNVAKAYNFLDLINGK